MEDYEFSKDVELRLEFKVNVEELKRENAELKRRLKDKVTLQSVFLAESYERDLESWRAWGVAVKSAIHEGWVASGAVAGFYGAYGLMKLMPHVEEGDDGDA